MKAVTIFSSLIGLFLVMPMWWYLWYRILTMVGATSEMWLIYWAYIPLSMFVVACQKICEIASQK